MRIEQRQDLLRAEVICIYRGTRQENTELEQDGEFKDVQRSWASSDVVQIKDAESEDAIDGRRWMPVRLRWRRIRRRIFDILLG